MSANNNTYATSAALRRDDASLKNGVSVLLTERDVANNLQVCSRTLRTARQNGSLRFVRFGRIIRYTPAHVADFIARAQVANDIQPLPNWEKASRSRARKIVPFSARHKRV